MIETLNNLQPVLVLCCVAVFLVLETLIPDVTRYCDRKKHVTRNLVLVLFCFFTNGIAAAWLTHWIAVIHGNDWGILNVLHLKGWVGAFAGVFAIDLDGYVGHILFHRVSWMWRLHRVHHSDNELDSTTSLRFHPLETLAQALWRTMSFALLGVPFSSFVIFYTLLLPTLFIQHANVRFPRWVEDFPGRIFVLSAWHKVHHSDDRRYSDSHFGNLFTIWDRLFGTYHRNVNIEQLTWGLREFQKDSDQTVAAQLKLPLRTVQ